MLPKVVRIEQALMRGSNFCARSGCDLFCNDYIQLLFDDDTGKFVHKQCVESILKELGLDEESNQKVINFASTMEYLDV